MMHNIDATLTNSDCEDLTCEELACEKQGRLGLVTINAPKLRNAINVAMRQKLIGAYKEWVEDPDIYTIIIQSEDAHFFSSGANIKEVFEEAQKSKSAALDCFKNEYETIWAIECYTKPVVALINGIVMGGGVGISQYGTHIVAGENYSWSMPEVKIGLFPDIAATQILANMPGAIGTYLGLTGTAVNRYDAVYLGLIEFCIDADKFETIKGAIRDAKPVDRLLDDMNQVIKAKDREISDIEAKEPLITRVFSKPTIEEIMTALIEVSEDEPENKEWALLALGNMKEACPLSLKVTLKAIQKSKGMGVDHTLRQDLTLANHFIEGENFLPAIEAKLINKTTPVWQPATLEEVSEEMVEQYFIETHEEKLNLPPREFGVDQ
ncbi:enoyl-CoA hydratase/isomerase family protein [Hyphomicrobiales bacterium 4NK60-0047b]